MVKKILQHRAIISRNGVTSAASESLDFLLAAVVNVAFLNVQFLPGKEFQMYSILGGGKNKKEKRGERQKEEEKKVKKEMEKEKDVMLPVKNIWADFNVFWEAADMPMFCPPCTAEQSQFSADGERIQSV